MRGDHNTLAELEHLRWLKTTSDTNTDVTDLPIALRDDNISHSRGQPRRIPRLTTAYTASDLAA